MTAAIFRFPPQFRLQETLAVRWQSVAARRLLAYAGRYFPGGLPFWVEDGWDAVVNTWRRSDPDFPLTRPEQCPWERLWVEYVEHYLRYQPEWNRAIEIANRNPEDAA